MADKSSKKDDYQTVLVENGDFETRDVSNDDTDTLCGLGQCHPTVLQCFAKVGCFTGFYSIAGLMTSTLSVYVNSQVTTLEKQFGFNSRQTGLIMAANDMGFLIFVLFVSYTANMVHIPRALGIATIIYGISGLVCALPHFLYGRSLNKIVNTNSVMTSDQWANHSISMNRALHGQLCQLENGPLLEQCQNDENKDNSQASISQQAAVSSLAIIVIGMMLQGIGKTPRSSFTITYIDNNTKHVKTGFFMGIIIALAIFGPALAFAMGGIFTRMYVTLEATNLTPKHPRWIGAWWLGYAVFGIIAIVVAVPLLCFPKRLPRKGKGQMLETQPRNPIYKGLNNVNAIKEKQLSPSGSAKLQQNGAKHHRDPQSDSKDKAEIQPSQTTHKVLAQVKEFLQSFLRILTNPVCMLVNISNCFIIFTVSGTSAYTPKYLERVFDLAAHQANYIMAAKTLVASCFGTFIGGYLSKRWELTAFKSLVFTVTCVTVSTAMGALLFFLYCDQPQTFNAPGSNPTCTSDCQCEENSYFPVCGEDGKTYYSPCSAGCQSQSHGSYSNCTCIAAGGTAKAGICPYGCNQVYYYAVVSALRSLTGTLAIVPKLTVVIRCVQERDKPLALGLLTFMSSLFGWLLGPIVFGIVIDGICDVWDVKCGTIGRCLLYDNRVFRIRIHAYALVGQVGYLLLQICALVYAQRTGCLDKVKTQPEGRAGVPDGALVTSGALHHTDGETSPGDDTDTKVSKDHCAPEGDALENGADELNESVDKYEDSPRKLTHVHTALENESLEPDDIGDKREHTIHSKGKEQGDINDTKDDVESTEEAENVTGFNNWDEGKELEGTTEASRSGNGNKDSDVVDVDANVESEEIVDNRSSGDTERDDIIHDEKDNSVLIADANKQP